MRNSTLSAAGSFAKLESGVSVEVSDQFVYEYPQLTSSTLSSFQVVTTASSFMWRAVATQVSVSRARVRDNGSGQEPQLRRLHSATKAPSIPRSLILNGRKWSMCVRVKAGVRVPQFPKQIQPAHILAPSKQKFSAF
jgi:hypothetical protein